MYVCSSSPEGKPAYEMEEQHGHELPSYLPLEDNEEEKTVAVRPIGSYERDVHGTHFIFTVIDTPGYGEFCVESLNCIALYCIVLYCIVLYSVVHSRGLHR